MTPSRSCPSADPEPASAWVQRFATLPARRETALDVAAGAGRHTLLLRRLGYRVTAVDRDTDRLAALAAADPGIEVIAADLEQGGSPPFARRCFDLVVVARYLHRPLLPALVDAVGPQGAVVYETFARGHERLGRPTNPDWLLAPGELLELVLHAPQGPPSQDTPQGPPSRGRLEVVAYEHLAVEEPRPAVLQRIAALRRAPSPP